MDYPITDWSKHFWRRNLELSECEVLRFEPTDVEKKAIEELKTRIGEVSSFNSISTKRYFAKLLTKYAFDLYDPLKDEVITGLLSRIERLYLLVLENTQKGLDDVSRILLRCMADSVLTYCYLLRQNSPELFRKFKDYGEGKEKQLLLNLQDTPQSCPTLGGETVETLSASLGGGIAPERVDISLGNWIDVSSRDIAKELGLESVYCMIYDPASADIHGTWSSIKNINLRYCVNPLHRYHRVPWIGKFPYRPMPIDCATVLLKTAIDWSAKSLGFPRIDRALKMISSEVETGDQ
jgi:hypothetical protein